MRVLLCLCSIDIDECRLGYCNQLCNNSEGSFTCSCQDGYALEDDGRTCIGTLLPYHVMIQDATSYICTTDISSIIIYVL